MTEQKVSKSCILIIGSLDSANFQVVIKIIKSLSQYNLIHVISTERGILDSKYINTDSIRYYKLELFSNKILRFAKDKHYNKLYLLCHVLFIILESFGIVLNSRTIINKCEQIINSYNVHDVYTILNPSYSHYSIIKLKNKYKLRLYQFWIDQFSNKNYHISKFVNFVIGKLFLNRLRIEEEHLLRHADFCFALPETFINDNISKKYKYKIETFEIPYIQKKIVSNKSEEVIFAGAFVEKIREPQPVFDLLLSVIPLLKNDIVFSFYVQSPDLYKQISDMSGGRIKFYSYIDRKLLDKKLSESKMLLTIGNKGISQMPSKTVEYISYRKPILFFYADEQDASFRYFNFYPDVCCIDVRCSKHVNIMKLNDFLGTAHDQISYDELMDVAIFKESTLDYVLDNIQKHIKP